MKTRVLIFLTLILFTFSNAQSNNESLDAFGQNFNPKTINLSENLNVEDFSFLKEELKDVQVVMLGELTHDDGNIFEIKTSIIKYLYKEMGFKTIAFESGVYDVYKATMELNKGKPSQEVFKKSLFGIWSKTKEFKSFISFYELEKSNINLFGFDSQFSGNYILESLALDLQNYCNKYNLNLNLKRKDVELLLESLIVSNYFDENDITYIEFTDELKSLKISLNRLEPTEEHFYWNRIISSLLSLAKSNQPNDFLKNIESEKKEKDSLLAKYAEVFQVDIKNQTELIARKFTVDAYDNSRDKQMADNLLAYIKKHPNEKIICWGANVHFVNDMSSVDFPFIKDFKPMGSYVKEKLKDNIFSLAIVTAEKIIDKKGYKFDTPLKDKSFEYYLNKSPNVNKYVSMSNEIFSKPIYNRLFSYKTFIKAELNKLHDGYLYINKSLQSTRIKENQTFERNELPKKKVFLIKIMDSKSGKVIPSVYLRSARNTFVSNEKGEVNLINLKSKDLIYISSLGYKSKEILFEDIKKVIFLDEEISSLSEIILKVKASPYDILKGAIKKIKVNYPKYHFNSDRITNVKLVVRDTVFLDLDLFVKGYNKGYNYKWRTIGELNKKRWNIIKCIKPTNAFRFFDVSEDPVLDGSFLSKNKLKKFKLELKRGVELNGKQVYKIAFTTDREQFSYTNRRYFNKYSGEIFIDKESFAIVKVIENWERKNKNISEFVYFDDIYYFNDINQKIMNKEQYISSYEKVNEHYFLSNLSVKHVGVLKGVNGNIMNYEEVRESIWFNRKFIDVNVMDGNPIKNFMLKNVEYDKIFWNSFELQNQQ